MYDEGGEEGGEGDQGMEGEEEEGGGDVTIQVGTWQTLYIDIWHTRLRIGKTE